MRSKKMRAATLVTAAGMGLIMSAGYTDHAEGVRLSGDETPHCTTLNEYDRIQSFMYPATVAEIVGNDGWAVDTPNPDSFARGYRSCWAPGERMVRVWFEQDSRFSYDKAILDVNGRVIQRPPLARTVPFSNPGKPGAWDDLCWNRPVTIRGSYSGDMIQGTPGRDVIFAYAGNDQIFSGDGNDRICGRWGFDVINAGAGYDRVSGGGDGDLCLFGEVTRKC